MTESLRLDLEHGDTFEAILDGDRIILDSYEPYGGDEGSSASCSLSITILEAMALRIWLTSVTPP